MAPHDSDTNPTRLSVRAPNAIDALRKAAVGQIPVVGPIINATYDEILRPRLEQGRVDFINDLCERVDRLERQHRVIAKELADNPKFLEAFGVAIRVATFTRQEEKRNALRNAVLNSALPMLTDNLEQLTFLGLIERFNAFHLSLLRFLRDPAKFRRMDGSHIWASNLVLRTVILEAFPNLKGREFLADQAWLELRSAHLVEGAESLDNWGEGTSVMKKRTTPFGDRFIEFIADPSE